MIEDLCNNLSSLSLSLHTYPQFDIIKSYFINYIYPFEMFLHLNPTKSRQNVYDNFNDIIKVIPPCNSNLYINKVSSVEYIVEFNKINYTLELSDNFVLYKRTDNELLCDNTMHQVFKIKDKELIPYMFQQKIN